MESYLAGLAVFLEFPRHVVNRSACSVTHLLGVVADDEGADFEEEAVADEEDMF